jgi:hypothetical protein
VSFGSAPLAGSLAALWGSRRRAHPEPTELKREKLTLAVAERDIAAGEARVGDQCVLVARLRARGKDSAHAERLLDLLEATLVEWRVHRDLIVARIAQLEARRDLGRRSPASLATPAP